MLQRQVDAQLASLTEGVPPVDRGMYIDNLQFKLKSGRSRVGTEAPITSVVEWPQDFVFVGLDRQKAKYDDLGLAQWCAGFSAIINFKNACQGA